MFSSSDVAYRAGLSIRIGDRDYAYSLEYFMKHFVEYSKRRMRSVSLLNKALAQSVELTSVEAFLQASQSISTGERSVCDFTNPTEFFTFVINGRSILCPHDANCYVYDNDLVTRHPQFFPSTEITYLQMARFIADRIQRFFPGFELNVDAMLADSVIGIIQGEWFNDKNIEVLSVLIATLLIAEAKRTPSCFIPTLMILELIRNKCKTPFGDLYAWDNCLQHDVLVNQNGRGQSTHHEYIYPMLAGVPNRFNLNKKVTLTEHDKSFLNADKKYNRVKNQQEINASEYLIQLGGYFPLSHRFSYSELAGKRAEEITTLSDQKCFIAITDWLIFHKLARNIYYSQLCLSHHPSLDLEKAILTEVIFPEIWNKALQFAKPRFEITQSPRNYPPLLTLFGCRQKKASAEGVANAIFLIHTSSSKDLGPEKAKELKRQFQFWSVENECDFGIEEVEEIINHNYKL